MLEVRLVLRVWSSDPMAIRGEKYTVFLRLLVPEPLDTSPPIQYDTRCYWIISS